MKSAIRHLFIFSVIVLLTSFDKSDSFLITKNSIGQLKVCQSFDSIQLPFLADTTWGGEGLSGKGKFFGTDEASIMVEFPYYSTPEGATIGRLVTTSSKFATHDGISVGTTLKELMTLRPELWLYFIDNEYVDIFLEERYENSRIEYRFDTKTENEIWNLPFGHRIIHFSEVNGVDKLIEELGDNAKIREIAVVQTGYCEN